MTATRAECLGLGGLIAVVLVGARPQPAAAVVVSTTRENTSAPADDPGWDNVGGRSGATAVYLGDGWVLTANHVGPGAVVFGGEAYDCVPGSDVRLKNPPGMGLSTFTDLLLFRISPAPELPSLRIGSAPPDVGEEVLMIGRGQRRAPDSTAWQVDKCADPWTWEELAEGDGNYRGFKTQAPRAMHWGTNLLEDDPRYEEDLGEPADEDHNVIVALETSEGTIHLVGLFTDFDETAETVYEAQAVSGDSGGGVFYNNRGAWELTGIINAVDVWPNQPGSANSAIFGNATFFSDLSVYRDQIAHATSVPEPSTLALSVAGLLAALGLARLTRRQPCGS